MEHWERWKPLSGIPTKLYNDSLLDSEDGFIMEFSDEYFEKKVIVRFEDGVLSYRNTDEGSLLKTWDKLDQQYNGSFYSNWPLFKIKNSKYLKWFFEESMGIYEREKVEHYVFITPDDVIEVLSAYPPKILIEPMNERGLRDNKKA